MLITKKVKIKPHKKLKYYKSLGYNVKSGNDEIEVDVKDLSKGSHVKVVCKCDICGKIKEVIWNNYTKSIKKHKFYTCSSKCSISKNKKTNLEKWGVEWYSQTENWKEKTKKTNLEKWNKEWYMQTKEWCLRFEKTNLKKWCVKNPSKNKIVKNKIKETNLKRWGIENPFQNEQIKKKIKETKKKKWGNENWNNIEKHKKTNLEKWGVEWYSQTEERNENIKKEGKRKFILNYNKNCLDYKILKYNDDNFEFLHKDKNCIFKIDKNLYYKRLSNKIEICTICNPKRNSVSSKEKDLLNFIKENYKGKIITNDKKILNGKELDIYLPEKRIAFEFNGLYWHSDLYKDEKYHLNKEIECNKKGICLIHIWEDDWENKKEIIKSLILNKLGILKNIKYKKHKIKEVDKKVAKKFLNRNSIKGYCNSKWNLGYYRDGLLISLLCFDLFKNKIILKLISFKNNFYCDVLDIISYFNFHYNKNNKKILYYSNNFINLSYFKFVGKTKPKKVPIVKGDKIYKKSNFNNSFIYCWCSGQKIYEYINRK